MRKISFIILSVLLVFVLSSCELAVPQDSAAECETPLVQPPVETGESETAAPTGSESDTVDTDDRRETTSPVTTDPTVILFNVPKNEIIPFESLASYIVRYPNLQTMVTGGVILSAEQYIELCGMNPGAEVISLVEFEGTVLDFYDLETDISGKTVEDKALFERVIACAPSGRKIVMCDCGYTNEEMGELREKYPEIEFAWRIYMGKWNLRTDDEAFGVQIFYFDYKRLTSEDIEVLKYCTNLKALDLGHQAIDDLSVIGTLTELRVLILADNQITDISPLANLKKLQYLELFVNALLDLSPLASCTELVDLNFGWNYVWDMSCLYGLEKIERLWLPNNRIIESRFDEIREEFSGAKIVFDDKNSVSSGWREHERYWAIIRMFREKKYEPDFVRNDGEL